MILCSEFRFDTIDTATNTRGVAIVCKEVNTLSISGGVTQEQIRHLPMMGDRAPKNVVAGLRPGLNIYRHSLAYR